MFNDEKKIKSKMLNYVEEKYNEQFEAIYFDKGDLFFSELYGDDRLMVASKSNSKIAFWIFKESKGFSDNYVTSYFSYVYNEQYKNDVLKLADRAMYVQFAVNFSNLPQESALMRKNVNDIVADQSYRGYLNLYIAIPLSKKLNTEQESQFLYELYLYMNKSVSKQFLINIGYINDAHLNEAEKLLRYSPVLNFDWSLLSNEAVHQSFSFGSNSQINESSVFAELIK